MKAKVIEKSMITCDVGSVVVITAEQAKALGNRVEIIEESKKAK